MSRYESSVEATEEGAAVVLGSQRLTLPGRTDVGQYYGRKIIIGIRPEDLGDPALGHGARGGATAAAGHATHPHAPLAADARLIEVLGSEQHVHFSVDATPVGGAAAAAGGTAPAGSLAAGAPDGVARLDSSSAIRAGTRVMFSVDTDRLHFFDADTGQAIATSSS